MLYVNIQLRSNSIQKQQHYGLTSANTGEADPGWSSGLDMGYYLRSDLQGGQIPRSNPDSKSRALPGSTWAHAWEVESNFNPFSHVWICQQLHCSQEGPAPSACLSLPTSCCSLLFLLVFQTIPVHKDLLYKPGTPGFLSVTFWVLFDLLS